MFKKSDCIYLDSYLKGTGVVYGQEAEFGHFLHFERSLDIFLLACKCDLATEGPDLSSEALHLVPTNHMAADDLELDSVFLE